jgi:murein peptide amidase A
MAEGDILQRLDGLPFPEVIGRSSEGRPIRAGRFGGDNVAAAAPATLLVVAGVHGDEPSSVEGVADLALQVAGGKLHVPGPFWLIPALNPDGLFRGGKNSARDVDLNRNFPAQNFTAQHQPGYFPGPAPLSEPETQALAQLIARQSISRVVAVHAPFACVNYDGPAADWALEVSRACGWPVKSDIGYPTPGSLGSWLGGDRGCPILTLELPPGPFIGFAADCRAALAAAVGATVSGDSAGAFGRGNAMNRERIR